jgi:fumarate reductase subunit C
MSARTDTRLWLAQRISAMVLGACVLVHIVTILYAMHGGLTAAQILARTHGSWAVAAFYTVFVAAVAVHAPIGLRAVLAEWLGLRGAATDRILLLAGMALAIWGFRAVWAVVA